MLLENTKVRQFTGAFRRSENQINKVLESDAELIRLDAKTVLALTTDNIVEEITSGLYTDPHQMGWMTVVASLSDLAAVGAHPLGINIMMNIPAKTNQGYLDMLAKGIEDACIEHGTTVLGGDTNSATTISLGGAAIGIIDDNKILMRKGAKPGDYLFTTGKMGLGNAFAYNKLILNRAEINYYPSARLKEGKIVRQYASSCIDTSDGFIPAISNLIDINNIGIALDEELDSVVDEELSEELISEGIPPWILLAGPHGEFELLFTIPKENINDFMLAAGGIFWSPICLGRIIVEPVLNFQYKGNRQQYDPSVIANLFSNCEENVNKYFSELLKINESWLQKTEMHS